MTSALPAHKWRRRASGSRIARLLVWLGAGTFLLSWLITLWLNTSAAPQPTGPYQFAYAHNGQITYVTALQNFLAALRHVLSWGWPVALLVGLWLTFAARRR